MDQKHKPRNPELSEGYIVEVIGTDGITHHVGPFKQLARAKDWIAQNERPKSRKPRSKQHA